MGNGAVLFFLSPPPLSSILLSPYPSHYSQNSSSSLSHPLTLSPFHHSSPLLPLSHPQNLTSPLLGNKTDLFVPENSVISWSGNKTDVFVPPDRIVDSPGNKTGPFVPADKIVGRPGNKTDLFVPADSVSPCSGNKTDLLVPANKVFPCSGTKSKYLFPQTRLLAVLETKPTFSFQQTGLLAVLETKPTFSFQQTRSLPVPEQNRRICSPRQNCWPSWEQNRPFGSSEQGFSLLRNKTEVFVPARNDGGQWRLRSIFRGADATARHHRRQSAKQLVQPDVSDARFCVQAVRKNGETGIVTDSLYKRNAHSRYFMYKQFLQHHLG